MCSFGRIRKSSAAVRKFFASGFLKARKGGVGNVKLAQKQQVAQDLKERFAKSKIVIVTDYMGLDVSALNALRRQLREADCEYQVVKNTLLIRASEGTDIAVLKEAFKGPNAVALSYEDPVAPARVLMEFAKANSKLEIKAGALKGKLLNAGAIKSLSELPSREILLSQLLSTMNGVPAAFVRVLGNIPRQMLNVLVAIKDKKSEA